MGPIDYLGGMPQIDLGQKFLSGLQAGAGIGEIQQQAEARQLALQQKQLAMQRAAQYQSDVSAALAAPKEQQAQLFSALALRNPEQSEAIAKSFGTLTADQQKSELQDTWQIASLLHSDRPDLALQQIDQRIEAHKNGGQPTADLEALRGLVDKDPKAAYGQVLHIASALPGGDKILSNLSAATKYQSEADQAPAALRTANAKAGADEADATLKNLGVIGQTLGSLQGKSIKPDQAKTAINSLVARGVISKDEKQAWLDAVPTDPKALDAWLGQQRAAGMKPDEQMKYTTPDANTLANNATQVRTTGMNNATQLAVQDRIDKRQESKGDAEPTLDTDTLTTMAQQYLAGDKSVMQNLGRGAQGAANIVALRKEITAQAKAQGMTGPQIAAQMADYAGMTAGLRTSANISARVENAISEAKELAPLAIEAGRNVARSGFLPFGKAQVMFDTQTNDPALKKFATANNGLVSAYAGAMARGQKPTVSDYDHARETLAAAQSQQAYEATVNQMFAEMAAASKAPQNVRQHLRDQIGGGSSGHGTATVPNPVAAPAIPTGWTVREH